MRVFYSVAKNDEKQISEEQVGVEDAHKRLWAFRQQLTSSSKILRKDLYFYSREFRRDMALLKILK